MSPSGIVWVVTNRRHVGGVSLWAAFFPWPSAVLTFDRDTARLVCLLGRATYDRSRVERVVWLKGPLARGIFFQQRGRKRWINYAFLARHPRQVLTELSELGWPVFEEVP